MISLFLCFSQKLCMLKNALFIGYLPKCQCGTYIGAILIYFGEFFDSYIHRAIKSGGGFYHVTIER